MTSKSLLEDNKDSKLQITKILILRSNNTKRSLKNKFKSGWNRYNFVQRNNHYFDNLIKYLYYGFIEIWFYKFIENFHSDQVL